MTTLSFYWLSAFLFFYNLLLSLVGLRNVDFVSTTWLGYFLVYPCFLAAFLKLYGSLETEFLTWELLIKEFNSYCSLFCRLP